MTAKATVVLFVTLAVLAVVLSLGCTQRPSLLPNKDESLRKTSAEFAADAAKRFPYPADAPQAGEATARAEVGYMLNQITLVNLSDEDWADVEVWVNQAYVVAVPAMKRGDLKTLPFQMLYNDAGKSFPTDNMKTHVNKVEVRRDGSLYDVPVRLGD